MKNGVKATYVPLFATMRGRHNTGAAEFSTHGTGTMHDLGLPMHTQRPEGHTARQSTENSGRSRHILGVCTSPGVQRVRLAYAKTSLGVWTHT